MGVYAERYFFAYQGKLVPVPLANSRTLFSLLQTEFARKREAVLPESFRLYWLDVVEPVTRSCAYHPDGNELALWALGQAEGKESDFSHALNDFIDANQLRPGWEQEIF